MTLPTWIVIAAIVAAIGIGLAACGTTASTADAWDLRLNRLRSKCAGDLTSDQMHTLVEAAYREFTQRGRSNLTLREFTWRLDASMAPVPPAKPFDCVHQFTVVVMRDMNGLDPLINDQQAPSAAE